jgi:hypothetical protein
MTRKDFELIAGVIKTQREKMHNETETVDEVALAMAEALEDTNPRFNRETFLTACGVK